MIKTRKFEPKQCNNRCPFIRRTEAEGDLINDKIERIVNSIARHQKMAESCPDSKAEILAHIVFLESRLEHQKFLEYDNELVQAGACKSCPGLIEHKIGSIAVQVCRSPNAYPFYHKIGIQRSR